MRLLQKATGLESIWKAVAKYEPEAGLTIPVQSESNVKEIISTVEQLSEQVAVMQSQTGHQQVKAG